MLSVLLGIVLIVVALHDSFETLVLPRRVTRRVRLARAYFRGAWKSWRLLCNQIPEGRHRQNILGVFGPLSLLGMFVCWVTILITGFALIHWGLQTLPTAANDFRQCLYHSGETFFTLGYGDVTPVTYLGKFLAVVESGMGFGFMAVIIGYLPVLYQAFSSRERTISLLDARAGSPPTAGELWRRVGSVSSHETIERFFVEWEQWSAELLESHLSFPILGFYRSQHDNQSWLAALALVLDASTLLLVHGAEGCRQRARLTFAMARHAAVDICLVFGLPPQQPSADRLTDAELQQLLTDRAEGADNLESPAAMNTAMNGASISEDQIKQLRELQSLYEPFLQALSNYFCYRLPRFVPDRPTADNWQTSPWTKRAPNIADLSSDNIEKPDHFG